MWLVQPYDILIFYFCIAFRLLLWHGVLYGATLALTRSSFNPASRFSCFGTVCLASRLALSRRTIACLFPAVVGLGIHSSCAIAFLDAVGPASQQLPLIKFFGGRLPLLWFEPCDKNWGWLCRIRRHPTPVSYITAQSGIVGFSFPRSAAKLYQ